MTVFAAIMDGQNDMITTKTFYCLLFALLLHTSVLAQDRLTVGWVDAPPYQWQDENGKLHGLDIEMARLILHKAGFEAEFRKMPWNRILKAGLRNGDIDIALGATKTAERESFSRYSHIPYVTNDNGLFILDSNHEKYSAIQSLHDTLNYDITIGVKRGSIYSKEYEALLNDPKFSKKLSFAPRDELLLKMLISGRVEAIISGRIATRRTIKQLQGPNEIILHSHLRIRFGNSGSYLMYSKKSVSVAQSERLNNAMSVLQKDGSFDTIINKYLLAH